MQYISSHLSAGSYYTFLHSLSPPTLWDSDHPSCYSIASEGCSNLWKNREWNKLGTPSMPALCSRHCRHLVVENRTDLYISHLQYAWSLQLSFPSPLPLESKFLDYAGQSNYSHPFLDSRFLRESPNRAMWTALWSKCKHKSKRPES